MPEELVVNLAERSYPIVFGRNIVAAVRARVEALRASGRRVAAVTDRNVVRHLTPELTGMFDDAPVLTCEPGEHTKSLTELGRVLEFLAEEKIDRTGVLFAVGGGVIGDLGGLAAAVWLRGIEFYQVPTTLLAMVDSSVGGKTGINLSAGKNLVGAFHQPRGVFVGTEVLTTLPPREFAAGAAEIIKSGLLGDADLFARLEHTPLTVGSPDLAEVIRRCCALKARVVEADERELAKDGGRALLNLGHTFGHAIEQVTAYGTYLHGEAVAIGLCAAARLSARLGLIDETTVARIDSTVAAHGLPTRLRAPLSLQELLAAMARDKKVRGGLPRFVVLEKLGSAVTRDAVAPALVEDSFCDVGAAG